MHASEKHLKITEKEKPNKRTIVEKNNTKENYFDMLPDEIVALIQSYLIDKKASSLKTNENLLNLKLTCSRFNKTQKNKLFINSLREQLIANKSPISLLHFAILKNAPIEIIKLIIETEYDIFSAINSQNNNEETLLHTIAELDAPETLKLVMPYIMPITLNLRNTSSLTALEIAMLSKHNQIIKLLMKRPRLKSHGILYCYPNH